VLYFDFNGISHQTPEKLINGLIIKIDMGEIITQSDLSKIRKEHKKIAFCTGCYDILQPGHVVFFKQCKKFADTLVVSVGSDKVIKELKGPERPINPENNRLFLVSEFSDVDYALLDDEEIRPGKINFYNILKELKPDVFVLNDDDSGLEHKKKLCDEFGIKIELVPRETLNFLKKTSTTEIADKIKKL